MTKNTLLALAAFITSLANEAEGATTQQPTPDPDVPPAPKKPRGRPPGAVATPPPETVAPVGANVPVESDPAPTGGKAAEGGKTIEDMRALIEPLIKGSWNGKPQAEWQPRGSEVRPIILKYAPTLIQMEAKDYPAFEKDIEALLY